MRFETLLLHAPDGSKYDYGALLPSIAQSAAFTCPTIEELSAVFKAQKTGFSYSRSANPSVKALEQRILALEGGIGALACSSGMAAVSCAVMNLVGAGDEIIAAPALFGGTLEIFTELRNFGVRTVYVDKLDPDRLEESITPRTRLIFGELFGNPSLDVLDIKRTARIAHRHGLPFMVDATIPTPYIVKPFELGADYIVHSTTKYLTGNGSTIGGVIVDGGSYKFDYERYPGLKPFADRGSGAYMFRLRRTLWRNLGSCMAPLTAYLTLLGLETLSLRMKAVCENARALAEFFKTQSCLTVNYPGLEDNPYHDLIQEQYRGLGSGIITISLKSEAEAFRLLNNLKLCSIETNIGDSKTLVIHPKSTIYCDASEEECRLAGVTDGLIRISVGLENPDDLIEDFRQAAAGL